MKQTIIIVLFLISSLVVNAGIVRMSGSLKEFKMEKVDMNYSGIAAEVYRDKTIGIEVDGDGEFRLELKLKRPAYYTVGQNVLYLSPGDELRVNLARAVGRSSFEGRGAAANNYLKNCENLSSWTIFGMAVGVSLDSYLTKIDSLIGKRVQQLEDVEEVSDEFRELEAIRIKALKVRLYQDYFMYGKFSKWDDKPEVKLEKKQAFYHTIKPLVEPLLKDLTASDRYLELPEVREMLKECYTTQVFDFPQSLAFLELTQVLERSEVLDKGLRIADYKASKEFARKIRNKDLQHSYLAKLQERAELMEGRPAPDITLQDTTGKISKLSDLKGKILFIDVWATWCLPCLAQIPHFEELSEKYPGIQFVGISVDQDLNRWKEKLKKDGIPPRIKEFVADPYAVEKSWDLASIPRFILIDKDFRIITAFASRPSDKEETEALLRDN